MFRVFKDIYQYRELLKTNTKKEIRGKYKNSILGVLWSFLNPLILLAVYALIFPIIFNVKEENYAVFIFVALIPWTFFTTTIIQGLSTMVQNANIIKKVYFPREILPISVVNSGLVNFLISCVIILVALFISGVGISKYILFFPLIMFIQYLLILAIVFITSSITVYLRDVEHFIGVLLNVMFYVTPIVYDVSKIPENYKLIFSFNPMVPIIDAYRNILYYQRSPDIKSLVLIGIISVVGVFIGHAVFKKLEKGFAEEL